MFKVVCDEKEIEVVDLKAAMDVAKSLGKFVHILGNGLDIVGIFGADSVRDGKCPNGTDYTWRKRR